jgi:archaellum component FlaC
VEIAMQATTTPQPVVVEVTPPAPQAPAAPGMPGGPTIVGVEPRYVSLSKAQIQALRDRRAEISNQLENVSSRRKGLADQLHGKTGQDLAGLEQRIRILDDRIVQMETDLAVTGRQLTQGMTTATTSSPPPFLGIGADNAAMLGGMFTMFVMAPFAFAITRRVWKRTTAQSVRHESTVSEERIQQLEQSVDAIALEIERVSEGQRYVARIITEAKALTAGQWQEPVRVAEREKVLVPRESGR